MFRDAKPYKCPIAHQIMIHLVGARPIGDGLVRGNRLRIEQ